MVYLSRLTDPVLDELLAEVPCVMLVGPRACGKTTSARRHANSVLQLDRPQVRAVVDADPDAALREENEPILVDEWQFVPEVLGAVKRAVDERSTSGRFLLTGSAAVELGNAGWAMAGRVVRVPMWGLTQREIERQTATPSIIELLFAGDLASIVVPADAPDVRGYAELALRGMPPDIALSESASTRTRRLGAYVEQITLRDGAVVGEDRDPRLLWRYLMAIAANSAGAPDHKTLFDAAQISRRTAVGYDSLLELLFVTEQVPAWASNRLSRLTRTPKRYLTDPGLLGPLLGVDARALMRNADLLGRAIDTFVVAQLRPELTSGPYPVLAHHLRDDHGRHEVDLVLEAAGGAVVAIEIKATSTPSEHDARHLEWMRDRLGEQFVCGVVFHSGVRSFVLSERIQALPIASIWGPHRRPAGRSP